MALSIPDYVVIVAIQIFCAALGLFLGRKGPKEATVENFILGGRTIPPIPVGFSIVATTLSAVAMSQGVSEIYMYGVQYVIIKLGAAVACVVCLYLIIPTYYRRMYITLNEYIGERFGQRLRILYTLVYLVSYTLYLGAVLYIPAMALSNLAGIHFAISVCASGGLCIFYCFAGGMRSIIWIDALQLIFMNLCLLVVMIQGTINLGGPSQVVENCVEGKRLTEFIWTENSQTPYSVFSLFVNGFVLLISCICASQAGFQRVICVESYKQCKISLYTSTIMICVFGFLVSGAALVVFAGFRHCDPLRSGTIKATDELLVFFINHELEKSPGLKGFALSGIFCGSLSTLSSYINSFAAVVLHDLVKVALPGRVRSEKIGVYWCQAFTLLFGLITIGVTFLVPFLGGVTDLFQAIVSASGGPLLGVVCLAMFSRKLDGKGASIALVVGLIISLWIAVGSCFAEFEYKTLPLSVSQCKTETNISDHTANSSENEVFYNHWKDVTDFGVGNGFPLYRMSTMWQGPLGFLITVVLGIVFSLIPCFKVSDELDDKLFHPLKFKKTPAFTKNNNVSPGKGITLTGLTHRTKHIYTVSHGNHNDAYLPDRTDVQRPMSRVSRPDVVMVVHENSRPS